MCYVFEKIRASLGKDVSRNKDFQVRNVWLQDLGRAILIAVAVFLVIV